MSVLCGICKEPTVSPQDFLNHVYEVHPEQFTEPERWPDGKPVVRYIEPTIANLDHHWGPR